MIPASENKHYSPSSSSLAVHLNPKLPTSQITNSSSNIQTYQFYCLSTQKHTHTHPKLNMFRGSSSQSYPNLLNLLLVDALTGGSQSCESLNIWSLPSPLSFGDPFHPAVKAKTSPANPKQCVFVSEQISLIINFIQSNFCFFLRPCRNRTACGAFS